MGFGPQWTEAETKFLIDNYSKTLDKDLAKKIGRSVNAVSYAAWKLKLKKDYDFSCKVRKKLNFEITKGHFIGEDGVKKLPDALKSLLHLSK